MLQKFWELAGRQHGVVARRQLLDLGFTASAVEHMLETRRLHPLFRGVYAVGRPDVSREGRWMAGVLACGPDAWLSHRSAGALWGILASGEEQLEVSVPPWSYRRRPGLRAHRAFLARDHVTEKDGIPVTSPPKTLVDLAAVLRAPALERAVNEADRLQLVAPDILRSALDDHVGARGVGVLRRILDRRTFRLTDSELERRFIPLAARAGLPVPETQVSLNGFRVDFFFRELGLVVETDGLRYHRTPAQQARDRLRDQAHTAAGLTTLRFTHEQVRYHEAHVVSVLRRVARHRSSAAFAA